MGLRREYDLLPCVPSPQRTFLSLPKCTHGITALLRILVQRLPSNVSLSNLLGLQYTYSCFLLIAWKRCDWTALASHQHCCFLALPLYENLMRLVETQVRYHGCSSRIGSLLVGERNCLCVSLSNGLSRGEESHRDCEWSCPLCRLKLWYHQAWTAGRLGTCHARSRPNDAWSSHSLSSLWYVHDSKTLCH